MEYFLSMFRRPSLDVSQCEMFHVAPAMIVLSFPGSSVWVMMTILPASAAKCVVKCDVFTSDDSRMAISETETKILKDYLDHVMQFFEQQYEALKLVTPEEPPQYALLKDHVRLERLAGSRIYPTRRENKKSESFCKAEQRKCIFAVSLSHR